MNRPDDMFQDLVRRGLSVFQNTLHGVTQAITTGDGALRELDQALIGTRVVAPGEDTQKSMMEVLNLLQESLAAARDQESVQAPQVVQKAREVLARINQAEPSWRPGPVSITNANDMFRMAMRDLRGTDALMKVATGRGELEDVEILTKWATKLTNAMQPVEKAKETPGPTRVSVARTRKPHQEPEIVEPAKKKAKIKKKSPEKFALAIAEEIGDGQVQIWAREFSEGKLTEQQWLEKFTNYAAEKYSEADVEAIYDRAARS